MPTPSDIKMLRLSAGLTQTEAGMLVGAAIRTWQAWEAGDRNIPSAKWELFSLKIAGKIPKEPDGQ